MISKSKTVCQATWPTIEPAEEGGRYVLTGEDFGKLLSYIVDLEQCVKTAQGI